MPITHRYFDYCNLWNDFRCSPKGLASRHNWVAMEQYGNGKEGWLKQFLELPNGIPSHDTISRVFARLDPKEFEQCFRDWVKTISELIPGEIISIDGKTVKHSDSKNKGKVDNKGNKQWIWLAIVKTKDVASILY